MSMKDCDKELWKSVFVFNPISCQWQFKKRLQDIYIDVGNILDEIGADYRVIHTEEYIYIEISKLEGKYEEKY